MSKSPAQSNIYKWQRRILMVTVSLLVGLILAVALYPLMMDHVLIRQLGHDNEMLRERVIQRAAVRAKARDATRRRLVAALDTDDDRRFYGIASALNLIGQFRTDDRAGEHLDRMAALQFEATSDARSRWLSLQHQCIVDRDNPHQRRFLAAAIADPTVEVRETSAVLAAKLGDDDALRQLLADDEPAVRLAAAVDAALAGRTDLAADIAALLDDRQPKVVGAAGYALARLAPAEHTSVICRKLQDALPGPGRHWLLMAAMALDNAEARTTVDILVESVLLRLLGKTDSDLTIGQVDPMLLVAAGRIDAANARPLIRSVLAAAADTETGITVEQLRAAILAANNLAMPVRQELYDAIQIAWSPTVEPTMTLAVIALRHQIAIDQDGREAPSTEECIKLLQQAAVWSFVLDDPDDDQPPQTLTTPVASAAAAAVLWDLQAPLADQFVRNAAASHYTLPGDYVAWRLARSARPADAYAVGQAMLPEPGADPADLVYSDEERAAGAMLLALSAATPTDRSAAIERIRQRLEGAGLGAEDNPFVQHSYRCALLILGQPSQHEHVYTLLGVLQFPQRRALTALLVAGDRRAMDWMLWGPHMPPASIVELLIRRTVQNVAAVVAPQLPWLDLSAPYEAQLLMARVLADTYAINHASIHLRGLD